MRRVLSGLAFTLALALIALATLSAPQAPAASIPIHAAALNLNLNYSDPASDVFKLWTSNNSHVTDAGGFWIMSPSPGSVNLIRLSSTDAGTSVNLYLRVQTTIASRANTSYEIRLYSRADNRTHFMVDYSNGLTTLKQNGTAPGVFNLTANATISPASTLNVVVSKDLLGGSSNITAWNIDATAKQIAGNYTYEDFVWQQPGNPGSAPAFIQGRVTDSGSGAGLANVNVSTGASGYFTTTNTTGYYSLPASPGNYTLTFTLRDYGTVLKPVSVQYQQTQTVNAVMTKSSALGSFLWIIVVILLVVAAAAIAFVILHRRRPRGPN